MLLPGCRQACGISIGWHQDVDVDVDIGICACLGCCCCSSGRRCGDMLLDVVSSTRTATAILWPCRVHGGSPASTMYRSRGV